MHAAGFRAEGRSLRGRFAETKQGGRGGHGEAGRARPSCHRNAKPWWKCMVFFLLFRNACFPTASAAKAEARQRPHSRELPTVQAVTAKRHFPLGGTEIPAEGRVCEPEGRFGRPEHHAEGML